MSSLGKRKSTASVIILSGPPKPKTPKKRSAKEIETQVTPNLAKMPRTPRRAVQKEAQVTPGLWWQSKEDHENHVMRRLQKHNQGVRKFKQQHAELMQKKYDLKGQSSSSLDAELKKLNQGLESQFQEIQAMAPQIITERLKDSYTKVIGNILNMRRRGREIHDKIVANKRRKSSHKKSDNSKLKELQKTKEKILRMTVPERRKLYKCGSNFLMIPDIKSWPQYYSDMPEEKKTAISQLEPNESVNDVVSLWKGDITRLEVDAAVNPTNSKLETVKGVCQEIHKAAGSWLAIDCATFSKSEPGEAHLTLGYRSPASRIIHAVVPANENVKQLMNCYQKCFQIIEENKLTTVAFPNISAGIQGFPKRTAAKIALLTARNWLQKGSHAEEVGRIIFCMNDDDDVKIYEKMMQVYFPVPEEEDEDEDDLDSEADDSLVVMDDDDETDTDDDDDDNKETEKTKQILAGIVNTLKKLTEGYLSFKAKRAAQKNLTAELDKKKRQLDKALIAFMEDLGKAYPELVARLTTIELNQDFIKILTALIHLLCEIRMIDAAILREFAAKKEPESEAKKPQHKPLPPVIDFGTRQFTWINQFSHYGMGNWINSKTGAQGILLTPRGHHEIVLPKGSSKGGLRSPKTPPSGSHDTTSQDLTKVLKLWQSPLSTKKPLKSSSSLNATLQSLNDVMESLETSSLSKTPTNSLASLLST